ncbi:MAG: TlpA family protein disulfide reductase, partial [Clostridia bacterium]|nr:TlpA family protein disulfide reductase [Clostridia bacterium]
GTLVPGLELSQLTLLAEEGKTKFYLYPIEMTGAGMEDMYKEAMGDYYDEYAALKENYEAFLANISFAEAERPRDEGMAALETLVFEGTDLDGNTVNTADLFAGHKVTMVNFWATWCNPCIGELPELERMSKEFEEKGCQIVGICIDAYTDDVVATAKTILANAGVDYTNLRGWETLMDEIPTSGYPTTYYVDSEGKIIGNRLTGAAIKQYEGELDNALSLVG